MARRVLAALVYLFGSSNRPLSSMRGLHVSPDLRGMPCYVAPPRARLVTSPVSPPGRLLLPTWAATPRSVEFKADLGVVKDLLPIVPLRLHLEFGDAVSDDLLERYPVSRQVRLCSEHSAVSELASAQVQVWRVDSRGGGVPVISEDLLATLTLDMEHVTARGDSPPLSSTLACLDDFVMHRNPQQKLCGPRHRYGRSVVQQ